MKIARLVGFVLAAVMAVSLAVASMAFAEPEFKPTGATFKGTSGSSTLKGAENTIVCTADTSTGTISSATLAGGVVVKFTGCTGSSKTKSGCSASSASPAGAAGEIITKTLHGVLGLILPKGTGTGVGLLLLPVENKKFVTIAKNECTPETTVSGNVAGEVSPVGKSQLTGKLVFAAGSSAEVESIKDFDLSTGGLVKPELEAFGKEASEATEESITYSAATEVT